MIVEYYESGKRHYAKEYKARIETYHLLRCTDLWTNGCISLPLATEKDVDCKNCLRLGDWKEEE